LNDEHPDCPEVNYHYTWYGMVNFVYRAYWSNRLSQSFPKVVEWLPLGWKAGFGPIPPISILPVSRRPHLCSFVGTLRKRKRRAGLRRVLEKDGRCLCYASKGFERKENLGTRDYRYILLNSALVLSPSGHNRDCFRIYEALESGAIPIIDRSMLDYAHLGEEVCSNGDNDSFAPFERLEGYYFPSFGYPPCPLPSVTDWEKDLVPLLDRLSAPGILDRLQQETHMWYQGLKKKWKDNVRQRISALFQGGEKTETGDKTGNKRTAKGTRRVILP